MPLATAQNTTKAADTNARVWTSKRMPKIGARTTTKFFTHCCGRIACSSGMTWKRRPGIAVVSRASLATLVQPVDRDCRGRDWEVLRVAHRHQRRESSDELPARPQISVELGVAGHAIGRAADHHVHRAVGPQLVVVVGEGDAVV